MSDQESHSQDGANESQELIDEERREMQQGTRKPDEALLGGSSSMPKKTTPADNQTTFTFGGPVQLALFGITFILWLIGLAVIIVGALILADPRMSGLKGLQHFGPIQSAAILVIVIGVTILVIGFFGCFGAMTRNRCILFVYVALLMCLMILEISAMVLAWYYKRGETLDKRLGELIESAILQRTESRASYDSDRDYSNSFNRNVLDFVQYSLKCCGAHSPDDYHIKNTDVPVSCIEQDKYNNVRLYQKGCVDALQGYISSNGLALGLLCLAALVLQVVLVALAFVLACRSDPNGAN